jgi:hypothetical protein
MLSLRRCPTLTATRIERVVLQKRIAGEVEAIVIQKFSRRMDWSSAALLGSSCAAHDNSGLIACLTNVAQGA